MVRSLVFCSAYKSDLLSVQKGLMNLDVRFEILMAMKIRVAV
jgi:hypothetical protein